MSSWLLVHSSPPGVADLPTARLLAEARHDVTVVLTDDAVAPAVLGGATDLLAAGVTVLYDEPALVRRGLRDRVDPDALRSHDDIAALILAPHTRVVWQ